LKIVTIIGARPQFIKAAPVSKVLLNEGHTEIIIHTGQHYDDKMSSIFFRELDIHEPETNLGIGSGSHGWQTGQMIIRIEERIMAEKPDYVLVYGDTNSTLAGALAAVKLRIPVAHVEAGLRSFNKEMPEEHNRIITDHCSDLLFCPTKTAVRNLEREGITRGVHLVGDTMYDAVLQFSDIAKDKSTILQDLSLETKNYIVATVHRPYNVDVDDNLRNILWAFLEIDETVIFPVHPRTRQRIYGLDGFIKSKLKNSKIKLIDPVGYLDMLVLEKNARVILTDSGGIQKEAYFFGVPCVTMRPETEWVETVESGWNVLADSDCIIQAVHAAKPGSTREEIYGCGRAAERLVKIMGISYNKAANITT